MHGLGTRNENHEKKMAYYLFFSDDSTNIVLVG